MNGNEIGVLPEKDWTDALIREVKRVRRWPAFNTTDLSVNRDASNRVYIRFAIRTERLLERHPSPLRNVEPIVLVYSSIEAIGLRAPAVWSGRVDFPRNIGHINAGPADQPASLCLARAGLQTIYDRYGVDGVLDRLVDWFHDAKTGQLMKDGWEPVPVGQGQELSPGYFDIGFFQMLALESGTGSGWKCGTALLLTKNRGAGVVCLVPPLDLKNDDQVKKARKQISDESKTIDVAAYIPWVFVWSDCTQPISRQLFGIWNKYGEIETGLAGTGVEVQLPMAIVETFMRLVDPAAPTGRPLALLIGVWRPQPISTEIFGMATNDQARKLELRAYVLHCEKFRDNPINPAIEARQLACIQPASRKMLAFTSGTSASEPVALFGYGALGSCIADFLLRAGIPKMFAVDRDTLAPHNLARHSGSYRDLGTSKVEHLFHFAGALTFDSNEIKRTVVRGDIADIPEHEWDAISKECRIIVDATADERVRRHLARWVTASKATIVRGEIFDRGRLGALFVTGPENTPNLIDLYYALCMHALDDDAVANWLRGEQAAGTSSDELIVGMGCASATTRMPKYIVAQHASAFMPVLMASLNEGVAPGVGINPLGPEGTPRGWRWFNYGGTVKVLADAATPDWQVRFSPDATARLTELRLANGEIETGGYLYGGYDFALKQIYAIAVSDVPPGTKQSANTIDLGPAGRTPLERRIDRRAGGKLVRVGTWHSHPRSGSDASAKDRKTMEKFRDRDREIGVPTLLVISSPAGDGAYLWI